MSKPKQNKNSKHFIVYADNINVENISTYNTMPERIYNPITAMGFSAMFTFQLDKLRGKHCRHPIAIMGVVDTFGQCRLTLIVRRGELMLSFLKIYNLKETGIKNNNKN